MSRDGLKFAAMGGFVALLFFGAMVWAKGRDPFERSWFKVKVAGEAKAECAVVKPKARLKAEGQRLKADEGPWPVVIYLHGSGGNLLGSGNDLRQIAEMGVAGVGMDYCQTNEAVFGAQFSSLLQHLGRLPWADTNRMAWVGFSLGAQRLLSFALRHPDQQPKLLVRLAGGWIPELDEFKVRSSSISLSTLTPKPSTPVLLIHGEQYSSGAAAYNRQPPQ